MSEMFKNYPQPDDYIPNNRPRCHCKCKLVIMTGETSSHSFEIPFNVETDTLDYWVIYKLGLKDIIVKNKSELELTPFDESTGFSIITCVLSSDETKLFADTVLDTRVQIKFEMLDNSIAFTEIYKVKVVDSLEIEQA